MDKQLEEPLGEPLTSEELAERYHTTAATVRGWRYKRTGPKFFRAGKRVFYMPAAVDEWERDRTEAASA